MQRFILAWLLISAACGLNPARAGEAEALAISANIQAGHFPVAGILDPIFVSPSSNQIIGYTRCGDSAVWTGHYLAAEAFRYKVTGSAAALNNVRKAIAALKGLADVTGKNLLARCMALSDSPYAAGLASEEAHNGIYQAPPWIWVGNTSRDQYLGAAFGLAVAYDMVDQADVKAAASDLVTRLVSYLTSHNWAVVMPDGSTSTTFLVRPDEILGFVQIARHVNPDKFSLYYDEQRILLSTSVLAPAGVDVISDDSYFKFNLDYVNFYNLVRLEGGPAGSIYKKAYEIVRNHTANHQNAFFNMVDRALQGPNAVRDAETVTLLDQWLQRPQRDYYVDLHGSVPVCGSQACDPIPVPLRTPTDFLWQRSPFQLSGGGSGTIENAGIDYILPYWMARYYGVISPFTVQSAAAALPRVAAESLASLYGPNLAGQTAAAATLPPPTALGGIGVKVKDSAGTERDAPLLFVSPGQVNFQVPAGTAPGSAIFTIVNGTSTVTAGGVVQTVAPTLFSMNGTGSGVAAATALRGVGAFSFVQVFSCGGNSGCVSTPIDLSGGVPVYLTLYGTGIRNRTSVSNVKATVQGASVPVLYAGAQPQFPGLDQVNVSLPAGLSGSGEVNVVVTVDGQTSNTVTVNIR